MLLKPKSDFIWRHTKMGVLVGVFLTLGIMTMLLRMPNELICAAKGFPNLARYDQQVCIATAAQMRSYGFGWMIPITIPSLLVSACTGALVGGTVSTVMGILRSKLLNPKPGSHAWTPKDEAP